MRPFTVTNGVFSALLLYTPAHAQTTQQIAKEICKSKTTITDVRDLYIQSLMGKIEFAPRLFLSNNGTNPYVSMKSLAKHVEGCWVDRLKTKDQRRKKCEPFLAFMNELDSNLLKLTLREGQPFRTNHEFVRNTPTNSEVYQFIFPDPNNVREFAIFCATPTTSPSPHETGEEIAKKKKKLFDFEKLEIANDVASLGKPIKKKKAAEFALTLDQANKIVLTDPITDEKTFKKNEVIEAAITFGYKDIETIRLKKSSSDYNIYVTPFVSWQYKSNLDPQKETDNLSIGAKFLSLSNPSRVGEFRVPGLVDIVYGIGDTELSGAYITDLEQRDSKQWAAEFRVGDAIDIIPEIFGIDHGLSVTPVVDYSYIDEFDDKIKLKELDSYTRLGYDIEYFAYLIDVKNWKLGLNASYKFRDTIANDPANADFVMTHLQLKPGKNSNFSYGIKYERGEILTSLEEVEKWKVTIGYKQ